MADARNSDQLPSVTGFALGSPDQRWNGYIQNLDVSGAVTGGNLSQLINVQGFNLYGAQGTGDDYPLYEFVLPANTVSVGRGIRITASFRHLGGSAEVAYKLSANGAAIDAPPAYANGGMLSLVEVYEWLIFNLPGDNGGQPVLCRATINNNGTWQNNGFFTTAPLDFTSDNTLTFSFNGASTDTVTGNLWLVELI